MLGFAWRSGVVSALLLSGCAGELYQDPTSFELAFGDRGGTTGTVGGGGASTGGAPAGGMSSTGGAAAGAGGGPAVPPDEPCVSAAFASKCNLCHGGNADAGGHLTLDGPELGARLSTTVAKYENASNLAACIPGALIIDPADPNNSQLLKKLTGRFECGLAMPIGPALSSAELECIQAWVAKF